MNSHFSILSAAIRPEIQEQIAIGLLLVGNNRLHFHFSKNKLAVAKELLPTQTVKYLKDALRQINSAVLDENNKFNGLFSESETLKKSFSFNYLEYLSRYSNNILTFSSPKVIELAPTSELFETLFKKYVDEFGFIEKVPEPKTFENSKTTFFHKVESYFNIEQEVTSDDISGLIVPVKVDLIGQNDKPVYAQAIDLERQIYHIQNDLAIVFMLNKALSNAKGFHISSEPDKKLFPRQHDTWNYIRNWKESEYVDIKEVQKIEEYAMTHRVTPLRRN